VILAIHSEDVQAAVAALADRWSRFYGGDRRVY
jgi:hypothetical protein